MNVLSPENSCRADIYTKYGHGRSIGNVNIEMSYSFDDEFKKCGYATSATAVLIIKLLSQTSGIAVAALPCMCQNRRSVSSSYETNFIK